MEDPTTQEWFLRKHEDGTVFGPLSFVQLARWASSAQVAPHDLVSTDQVSWVKAPMLPELDMDWLVEVTTERFYGPTTFGAIQEFVRLGEVSLETCIINSCDGARHRIADLAVVLPEEPELTDEPVSGGDVAGPAASGMSINVEDRIRDLEQALREERRALQEADERYRVLELKYRELSQRG